MIGPTIEYSDGSLTSYIMPEPLTRGGVKVEVFSSGYPFHSGPAFLVLRGAVLDERRDSHYAHATVVEFRVEGLPGWVDDTGDRVYVAAVELTVVSRETEGGFCQVFHGYMGEPGGVDYSKIKAKSGPLRYWPRPVSGGRRVAERFALPEVGRLVTVVVSPESPLV